MRAKCKITYNESDWLPDKFTVWNWLGERWGLFDSGEGAIQQLIRCQIVADKRDEPDQP